MVNLRLEQLTFRIATGLAERHPTEQFLPEEINDALISVVNSVGEIALRIAIGNSLDLLGSGTSVEQLDWTREIETSVRFASPVLPRNEIVSSIQDLSGLDKALAESVLEILEHDVDEAVFGLRQSAREDVHLVGVGSGEEVLFEGIGVIRAGKVERSYYIILDESLSVPPLKHISILSRYERADEQSIGIESQSAGA